MIEEVRKQDCRSCAVIGMAKNTGKTVAFNTLIQEAGAEGYSPALVSFGRDGEKTDSITRHAKPPITIPAGTIFVTAEESARISGGNFKMMEDTGVRTPLGRVLIFKNMGEETQVELIGVNRLSLLIELRDNLLSGSPDLFLVDGALDRKSSAAPFVADGFFLATGAALTPDLKLLTERTVNTVKSFGLPEWDEKVPAGVTSILDKNRSVLLVPGKTPISMDTGFSLLKEGRIKDFPEGGTLFLSGALTDNLAERLCLDPVLPGPAGRNIVAKDGTKLFLNERNRKILETRGFNLMLRRSTLPLGITLNPWDPYGPPMDSKTMEAVLNHRLKEEGLNLPIRDLLR